MEVLAVGVVLAGGEAMLTPIEVFLPGFLSRIWVFVTYHIEEILV